MSQHFNKGDKVRWADVEGDYDDGTVLSIDEDYGELSHLVRWVEAVTRDSVTMRCNPKDLELVKNGQG